MGANHLNRIRAVLSTVAIVTGGLVAGFVLLGCDPPKPPPGFVLITAAPNPARPGDEVSLSAAVREIAPCKGKQTQPKYKWNFGGGVVVRNTGPSAVVRFAGAGQPRVVSASATGCFGSVLGGAYVWVVRHRPSCGKGEPFDLVWGGSVDPNSLPLNPEWRWQCAYVGFPVDPKFLKPGFFAQELPTPNAFCNGFSWIDGYHLDIGPNCSHQISGTDYPPPDDSLWWVICHMNTDPPYGVDGDTTVHGHVNWRPVAYTGSIKLTNIQGSLPWHLGDGDADLDVLPDASAAPQYLTRTLPGATLNPPDAASLGPGDWKIHAEFNMGEVLAAFKGDSQDEPAWDAAFAALKNQTVRGVVVGLFGLDARHGSYSELHPVYAMALRESQKPGSAKWIIFARNSGTEGGCSSGNQEPLAKQSITMLLPLPPGRVQRFATRSSYYSAPSEVSVVRDGAAARVTINLPPPAAEIVVAGELDVQTTAGAASTATAPRRTVAHAPAVATTVPKTLEEPEDLLRSLAVLLPSSSRSAPTPTSTSGICRKYRSHAIEARAHRQHPAQVHLVEALCRAAGEPF